MENQGKTNQMSKPARLMLPISLALLLFFALLWGLQSVSKARADPGILYVDTVSGSDDSDCSNSSDPCASIGYALSYAENGHEIHVAQGTYQETIDLMASIKLLGGYEATGWTRDIAAYPTIMDANGADHAVIAIHPELIVMIEGFILQGANHTSDQGGGIYFENATAVISATIIRNNLANAGGGISVGQYDEGTASLTLVNSALFTNTANLDAGGGLHVGGWPEVIVDHVEIRANVAEGGGGGIGGGRAKLTNCQVTNNIAGTEGGGIGLFRADIYDCVISGNHALEGGGGGILVRNGKLWLESSLIMNNEAASGAGVTGAGVIGATILDTMIIGNDQSDSGVALYNSPFTLTNVLVADNDGIGIAGDETPLSGTMFNVTVANNGYNGLQMTADDIKVTNSILWGNGGVDNNCTGSCTITFSNIGTGDSSGTGNISQNPKFFDSANGDYHLWASSPCVDSGTATGAPVEDLEGTPRDTMPDMGAFEWTGYRLFLPLTLNKSSH